MFQVNNIDKLEENLMNCAVEFREDHQSNLWGGQIVLIGDDQHLRDQTVDLISGIGGRIVNPLPIGFGDSDLNNRLNAVAVIFHVSRWDVATQNSLRETERFCVCNDLPILVLLKLSVLDDALSFSENPNIEYLMTDEPAKFSAELVVTLNRKILEVRPSTFEGNNETDPVDLKKISADVDRIARVLSELSGQQTGILTREPVSNPLEKLDTQSPVSVAPFKFKGETNSEPGPLGAISEPVAEIAGPITAIQIRDLIKARRLRDQYFDAELFADPAWDMLLDLMAAQLEGARVSVSSLCIAASVPPTTALRWIKTMTEENIFARKADEKDGRRIFIELSDETTAGMVGFFAMIRRSGLMIT